jgi:hypothetical protein
VNNLNLNTHKSIAMRKAIPFLIFVLTLPIAQAQPLSYNLPTGVT